MYGGVLFRPQKGFHADPQWRDLAAWAEMLSSHFAKAQFMLGVGLPPWDSASMGTASRQAFRRL